MSNGLQVRTDPRMNCHWAGPLPSWSPHIRDDDTVHPIAHANLRFILVSSFLLHSTPSAGAVVSPLPSDNVSDSLSPLPSYIPDPGHCHLPPLLGQ